MAKSNHIYKITRGYRSLTVWICSSKTRELSTTMKVSPKKGLNREEKYGVIRDYLEEFGIPAPDYKPIEKR